MPAKLCVGTSCPDKLGHKARNTFRWHVRALNVTMAAPNGKGHDLAPPRAVQCGIRPWGGALPCTNLRPLATNIPARHHADRAEFASQVSSEAVSCAPVARHRLARPPPDRYHRYAPLRNRLEQTKKSIKDATSQKSQESTYTSTTIMVKPSKLPRPKRRHYRKKLLTPLDLT